MSMIQKKWPGGDMFPVLVPRVDRFHSFSMRPLFSPSSAIKRHTNAHSSVTASQYCVRVKVFRFLADVFTHTEGSAGQTLNSGEKKTSAPSKTNTVILMLTRMKISQKGTSNKIT